MRDRGVRPARGSQYTWRDPTASASSRALFIAGLSLLQVIWTFTMDVYLPAFLQIRDELHTTSALVQVTLTGAFVGMAVGQLVSGPLSDAVGRKRPLLTVLAVHIVASVVCAAAPSIEVLIGARFVQGMASASCGVIGLAIVRDHFSGQLMVRTLAKMAMVNGVVVVLAPSAGAALLHITDWRGIFGALAGFGVLLILMVTFVLAESNPTARRRERPPSALRADYRALGRDHAYVAVVLAGALVWSGMFVYLASSSFIFQEVYGLNPSSYALVFASHGALMVIGSQLSSLLARRHPPRRIVTWALACLVVSALVLVGSILLFPGAGFLGLLIPLWLFTASFGLIGPAVQALALGPHPSRAGTAASLLGAANMALGAAVSPLAGAFGPVTVGSTVVLMAVCEITALVVFLVVVRRAAIPAMLNGMSARAIIIAPDSFKGTASATEVARALAAGWARVHPDDELRLMPMADGGEGTLEAFETAVPGSKRMPVTVQGPDDRTVPAYWLLLPNGTGVVELAGTSGITLLDPLRPQTAHTLGFGQAIAAALDHGVDRLLLAIGGSSSTDGGTGALTVLGAMFRDEAGAPIALGNAGLADLAQVDLGSLRPLPAGGAVILSDVTNPLLGSAGAAAVFGPQKGAAARQIAELETNLARLAGLVAVDAAIPGAGAAGGAGFGLLAWGATIAPGSAAVGEALELPRAVAGASVVITGEGRFDDQSAAGKVPSYLRALAMDAGAQAMLVAGHIEADAAGFAAAVSLTELAGSSRAAMGETLAWLEEAGARLATAVPVSATEPVASTEPAASVAAQTDSTRTRQAT
ncbi:glycerate kinase [Glaciibacter superstes]|uniref:glycerate kinase n=1 Tax=Glaciibacter superstes TaxID=501023 RepID=UPI0003B48B53